MIDWKPIETVPRGKVILVTDGEMVWSRKKEEGILSVATHWAEFEMPMPVIEAAFGTGEVMVGQTSDRSGPIVDIRVGMNGDALLLDRKNWEMLKKAGDKVFNG